MTTQPNIVEINRFEAFALHRYYIERYKKAKEEGSYITEHYFEHSQKWLDIACEIEKHDADGANESFKLLDKSTNA
jgi:hypothetical protein